MRSIIRLDQCVFYIRQVIYYHNLVLDNHLAYSQLRQNILAMRPGLGLMGLGLGLGLGFWDYGYYWDLLSLPGALITFLIVIA
jgi:hypothetical protein